MQRIKNTVNTAKNTVKNIVIGTTLFASAVTAASLYIGYKTTKTAIKIPALICFRSYKTIKNIKKCCTTIFETIEHSHEDCFDHYFNELDFDLVVQSINEGFDNINQLEEINDMIRYINERMEIKKEDRLRELKEMKTQLNKFIENKIKEEEKEQEEINHINVDLLQYNEETIIEQINQKKRLEIYEIIINYSDRKFYQLIQTRNKNYFQIHYRYDSFVSFIEGCLTLFKDSEMLSHVLSKIPLRCFDEKKIMYAYQIYHNKNQVEICKLLTSDKILYIPIMGDIFNRKSDSKLQNIYKKLKNKLDFEDKYDIFDDKIPIQTYDQNNLLTKEDLDRCIQLHYQIYPKTSFFLNILNRKSSIYLRSFLHYYGECDNGTTLVTALDKTQIHIIKMIEKSVLNQNEKRTEIQQFIMHEFLNEIQHNQYIDRSSYEQKNVLRAFISPELKERYKSKQQTLIKKIDESNVNICSDLANIIVDYAL
jgi:hypothetical protein